MSVAVASVEKINALKTGIETTTGESYNDLTEAVQDLKNGYGQSDGGEVGKTYIDTSKITNFSYFAFQDRLNEYLNQIDTSNGTKFLSMFSECSQLTTIPLLDTSKGTSFKSMFNGDTAITTIPPLDTSNGEDFSYMFNNCKNLTTISSLDISKATNLEYLLCGCQSLTILPPLDISKATKLTNMFRDCKSLTSISITTAKVNLNSTDFLNCTALTDLTIGEGWAVNIYLTYSTALTQESLHGMIENLADLTGATAKTFSVGATNLAKIDEEHIAMLQAKNWTYS